LTKVLEEFVVKGGRLVLFPSETTSSNSSKLLSWNPIEEKQEDEIFSSQQLERRFWNPCKFFGWKPSSPLTALKSKDAELQNKVRTIALLLRW
jgi:hypothetical protein